MHVQGSLGALPWQSDEVRAYIASYEPEDVQRASENINVISEGSETSEEFQRAFRLLETAARIYFLGFGYNSVNLRRLGVHAVPERLRDIPGRHPTDAPMLGTALAMGKGEMDAVKSAWRIYLPDNTNDSLGFLKQYARLD